MSVRTIALTLRPTIDERAALERLQHQFNAACNYISSMAWEHHEWNKVRLQRLVYRDVRERFSLLAQHTGRAIAVVADSYRADKRAQHTFRRNAAIVLDTPRLYRISHNRVSIATLDGRTKVQLGIGGYQRQMIKEATRLAEADLICDRKGRWRLMISAHFTDPQVRPTEGVLGVDLGRRDIAMTSEGQAFSGEQVTAVRDHYSRVRRSIQKKASKGTRSTRRRARALQHRLSGRESRFQRDVNHYVSKTIVARAVESGQAIAVEDLMGIRGRTNVQPRAKVERRRSNNWAFYQMRCFLAYKCQAVGVPLVPVNPAYTSQTCHCCLHLGERADKRFRCPSCGWMGDADYNGACMIARMGRSVMAPTGPWLSCPLGGRPAVGLVQAHRL